MFRTGVSTTAPEGLRWTSITVPPGCEVNQISIGPTGLVWAVLWNGRALVRAGVTRENPTGNNIVNVPNFCAVQKHWNCLFILKVMNIYFLSQLFCYYCFDLLFSL